MRAQGESTATKCLRTMSDMPLWHGPKGPNLTRAVSPCRCLKHSTAIVWPLSSSGLRDSIPATHIVCAQEITMTKDAMADMDAWGAPRGWTFLAAPSLTSRKGKVHLGSAVFVRAGVGVRWPKGQEEILVPGRVLKVMVDIPDWPPVAVISAYLPVEGHKTREYLECLGAIGEALEGEDHFIVAADWNEDPAILEATGLPAKVGAMVVAPRAATCLMGDTSATRLDYFLVSMSLFNLTMGADVDHLHTGRPHRPTTLAIREDAATVEHLTYVDPPLLAKEIPSHLHPIPPPLAQWPHLLKVCEDVVEASHHAPLATVQPMLDMAYRLYINAVEIEVEWRTDPDLAIKRYGTRGNIPKPAWTRVLGNVKKATQEETLLNAWKGLRACLSQASCLGAANPPTEGQLDMFKENAEHMAIREAEACLGPRYVQAVEELRNCGLNAPHSLPASKEWLNAVRSLAWAVEMDVEAAENPTKAAQQRTGPSL